MTDEEFMRRAIGVAACGMDDGLGGPFGAVIVQQGRVIAEAHNRVTSDNDPTAHAELLAIRTACRRLGTFSLAGCELYSSCEPCPMCFGAVHWSRLDRLYFAASRHDARAIGFDDALLYEQLALALDQRALPTTQHLAAEARAMMQRWLQVPDDRRY